MRGTKYCTSNHGRVSIFRSHVTILIPNFAGNVGLPCETLLSLGDDSIRCETDDILLTGPVDLLAKSPMDIALGQATGAIWF